MSRLSCFSPSQTKAISLPSGEKADWSSVPAKLVTGTIFRRAVGGFGVGRKIKSQTPRPTAAPKARKTIGQPRRLVRDRLRVESAIVVLAVIASILLKAGFPFDWTAVLVSTFCCSSALTSEDKSSRP